MTRAMGTRPSKMKITRPAKLADLERKQRGPHAGSWSKRRRVGESRRRHCPLHVPFWQLSHDDRFLAQGLDRAADLAGHSPRGPD